MNFRLRLKAYIFLLLTVLLNNRLIGSGIHKDLRDYEWEEVHQVARISNAAYYQRYTTGNSIFSMTELEDAGWDCKLIGNEKHYAVRAEYGPLVVLGFKGTTEFKDFITDFDLIRLSVTECGQQGCAHRGIYSYAKQLPVSLNTLFDPDKGDELLILTGHSLGGAVAQIKGFEAYDLFANSELTGFCSIATFGAPAVLDKPLKTRLNQIFPGYSNVQFRFENDGVTLFTRGPTLMLPEITTVDSVRSAFKHTGSKVILKSKGWFSHSMDECLRVLQEKNDQILSLWPNANPSSVLNVGSLDNIPESVLDRFNSSQTAAHLRGLKELYEICLNPLYKTSMRFSAWLELYNYYVSTYTKLPRNLLKLTRDLVGKRSDKHFSIPKRQLDPNGAVGIVKILLNSKEAEVRKFALQQLRIIIHSYHEDEIRQGLLSLMNNNEFEVDEIASLKDIRKDLRDEIREIVITDWRTHSPLRRKSLEEMIIPKDITQSESYVEKHFMQMVASRESWASLKMRLTVDEVLDTYLHSLENLHWAINEDLDIAKQKIQSFLNSELLPYTNIPSRSYLDWLEIVPVNSLWMDYFYQCTQRAARKSMIYAYWLSIHQTDYKYYSDLE